jgi:hypothetical protein
LSVRAIDDIAGAVPLMVVNVTLVEASECDKYSAQVGNISVLQMD